MSSKPTPIGIDTLAAVTGGEGPRRFPSDNDPTEQVQVRTDSFTGTQVWTGTSGNDSIDAGDGTDIVMTGQGDDTVALGAGNDRYDWYPGSGGTDSVDGGSGQDTLVIGNYEISPGELLNSFVPSGDSPAPIMDEFGNIDLTGVTGSFTVGGTTIQFTGMERVFIAERPVE
jgi:Ca2+-binding RTX toxin-like protein